MKRCPECGDEKPLEDFYKDQTKSDGRQGYCRACKSKLTKVYAADPWNKERRWELTIKRDYGISSDMYYDMLKRQGGGCAICGIKQCQNGGRMSVDHNHETSEVRGILCRNCNTSLGLFKDSPDLLNRAQIYIRRGEDLGLR